MNTILVNDLIYLAGFFDADGSVFVQLKPRKDYKMGWQVVITVQFTQHSDRQIHLVKFKDLVGAGYIRRRKDVKVSDWVIIEVRNVYSFLTLLKPYVRLKSKQVNLTLSIIEQLPLAKKNPDKFLQVAVLADKIRDQNDSKTCKYTSKDVEAYFKQNGML